MSVTVGTTCARETPTVSTSQAATAVNAPQVSSYRRAGPVSIVTNARRFQMSAVMGSVLTLREATAASVTMASRPHWTKPCAWILMSVTDSPVAMALVKTQWAPTTVCVSPALN